MPKRLLLIDATGLLFRAYFSLPPFTAPDGTPVGAVYGLVRMLLKLFRDVPATESAVVFDAGARTFRNDAYPQYKAHRPPPPDDLKPQFGLAIATAQATAAPVFSREGFEADDLIATLAMQAAAVGHAATILTSDRDILQLLSPTVTVIIPKKNDFTTYTPESFEAEYGFGVERFTDFKALMGDPSDNIPGVAGIGEKTAAHLVSAYGRLDQLYANLDLVKPEGVRLKLKAGREQAFLFRELVTLRLDAPVAYDFSARRLPDFGSPRLQEMLAHYGFSRLRDDAASLGDLEHREPGGAGGSPAVLA